MGIQADPQLPVPRNVADSSIHSTWLGDLTTFMLAVVVAALAGLAGNVLKTMSGEIAPIWFGNAVLLSQRMAAPDRRGGWVIAGGALGNLAAYLMSGDTLKVSFSYSVANVLEVLMVLAFVPRTATIYRLCRPKTFAVFVVGAMLTPLVSGVIAITMLRGQLEFRDLPDFANWSISDALSLAILTPAALIFWTGEVANLWRADTRLRTGLLLALVCAVTIALFAQSKIEILYWTLVPIVLLAFQADLAAVMLGLLLCLGIALSFTIRGSGPLGTLLHESMYSRIFHLQLYFLAALSIALPVSAIQSQRNRLVDMLRDGERRYRLLAENATDVVMSMALDGRLTYVSPRSHALLGYAPDHLVDTHFAEIALPEDRGALVASIARAAAGHNDVAQTSRLQSANGDTCWIETHLRPIINPLSGKPESLAATARDVTHRILTEQRLAQERADLEGLAFHDGLTGLFNRRQFDSRLNDRWQQGARSGEPELLAVVMIDIDGYKSYNDHYGHQRGDECLRTIAQSIADSAGPSAELVARFGGEEFALLLVDTDESLAALVAERIRQGVESLRVPHAASRAGIVTISLGVAAERPHENGAAGSLVAAADRALYRAKRQGRNRTCRSGPGHPLRAVT